MMSVSPGMASGQAGGYFSREDYYLHGDDLGDNSLWVGKGSRELGLAGPVEEDEFRALCRGEDPAGNRLVSPKISRDMETGTVIEQHRAGNDCTFSAPKSVSIAYAAGVQGIKEAQASGGRGLWGTLVSYVSFFAYTPTLLFLFKQAAQ